MRRLGWIILWLLCCASLAMAQEALIGPDVYPDGINPLTGLPVEDASVLERRPLLVKVINAPAEVRPQFGLTQADLVWEHLLAGGITRFTAIYLSQDPEYVGPIRSARLVDFELLRIYRGIVATSGMADGTLEIMYRDALVTSRVIFGAGPCPAFCRIDAVNEKLEYTLFANLPAVRELAAERGRDMQPEALYGMAFQADPPDGGVPLNSLDIAYVNTDVRWEYDATLGAWLRSQDDEPHLYGETGEQVRAANVLIMEDHHVEQPFVRENYWGPENFAFSVNFIGSGRAILLRDGHYYEGEWRRDTQNGVLTFFDQQGNVLPFKPGVTYFNLMPRWVGGYQLAFGLEEPATATVTSASVNLRWGPTSNFRAADGALRGDQLTIIGRNNGGSWLQLVDEGRTLWVSSDFVTVDRPIMNLPLARPTNED